MGVVVHLSARSLLQPFPFLVQRPPRKQIPPSRDAAPEKEQRVTGSRDPTLHHFPNFGRANDPACSSRLLYLYKTFKISLKPESKPGFRTLLTQNNRGDPFFNPLDAKRGERPDMLRFELRREQYITR
ncbi:hypothetical protein JTE90_019744 [Oedothorax gibbosus]|uniref:Uncharacterized protein n=1 Tax=Oedothorax gibbosus TaxID=931172 RepID=A0AAV6UPG1_9ARAC|nr:hypothetical protein JTE90_019744 [Oedothorax gibbosus]